MLNSSQPSAKHLPVVTKLSFTGAEKSSEEAQAALNQLNKEVEGLKDALQSKRAEAEELLQEVDRLKAALEERTKETQERKEELEEVKNELNELNALVEEKSREADESMDKYCTLMVQVHKLEQTNEALTTRLEMFTAGQRSGGGGQRRRSARKSVFKSQQQEKVEQCENVPPTTTTTTPPPRRPQGPSPAKRGHRDISNRDSAQEALHNLTKKIKASSVTTPKARLQRGEEEEEEDEEFRPEGLPELVQKGTARPSSRYSRIRRVGGDTPRTCRGDYSVTSCFPHRLR